MDDWIETLRSLGPLVPFIGLVVWILLLMVMRAMSRQARRDQTTDVALPAPRSGGTAQHGASEQQPLSDNRPIVPR